MPDGRRKLDTAYAEREYQGMILDGWHRYLACLATKTTPKITEFKGTNLEAAERVYASGIRRQSSADQRYASFLLLGEACPEFKDQYEQLKQKGTQQQEAGKPLSTDEQRVDLLKAKAVAAGVSRGTAAKVEKVKKRNPEAISEIAEGKTSANKVLAAIAQKARGQAPERNVPKPQPKPEFKPGDLVYVVESSQIQEWKVTSVKDDGYICTDGRRAKGKRFAKPYALTLDQAKQQWKAELQDKIDTEEIGLKELKEKLKKPPKIERIASAEPI